METLDRKKIGMNIKVRRMHAFTCGSDNSTV